MTSLVSALTARFWCCSPEDSAFFLGVCLQLGPLASFQSLLSVYGSEMMMFNDMIVAVEDLRNVEFTLILVDHQVWSLTQFYSVDFSQSRIDVKKCTIKVCVSCC